LQEKELSNMDEFFELQHLDNEQVHSLLDTLDISEEEFKRVNEQPAGDSEMALSTLILAITPIVIAGIAAWCARGQRPVKLKVKVLDASVELEIGTPQLQPESMPHLTQTYKAAIGSAVAKAKGGEST
jgi:hypothetical protein